MANVMSKMEQMIAFKIEEEEEEMEETEEEEECEVCCLTECACATCKCCDTKRSHYKELCESCGCCNGVYKDSNIWHQNCCECS